MDFGIFLIALFVLTIGEAVAIVSWCLHKRRQVFHELMSPESEAVGRPEPKLSPTEAAFLVSRGERVATLGVLLIDHAQNSERGYESALDKDHVFSELIAEESAPTAVNRVQKVERTETFNCRC